MVVSEIKLRLSPNMAPLMTEPMLQRHGEPAGRSCSHGDRRDQRDGSDAGSHRNGHEAAHAKEHRNGVARGDDREHEVSHTLCAAPTNDADENAGLQKDQNHGHDVLITDALTHKSKLVFKGERTILKTGNQKRSEKNDHDRDVIKSHRDFQYIFKQNTETEIQHDEHGDRQKCDRIGFDFF